MPKNVLDPLAVGSKSQKPGRESIARPAHKPWAAQGEAQLSLGMGGKGRRPAPWKRAIGDKSSPKLPPKWPDWAEREPRGEAQAENC